MIGKDSLQGAPPNTIFELSRRRLMVKWICGAAVQDCEEVERSAFLATVAGFEICDVSGTPAVIRAGLNGRNRALRESCGAFPTLIMGSVAPRGDSHVKKAEVVREECLRCGICIENCRQNAITPTETSVRIDNDRCRGCEECIQVCPQKCFKSKPMDVLEIPEAVRECAKAGAEAVELHLSGLAAENLAAVLDQVICGLHPEVISVCIGSLEASPSEIVEATHAIATRMNGRDVFIQTDGKTMSGSTHGFNALAAADIALSCKFAHIHIIASGGCGPKTFRFAQEGGLPIAGIGMGIAIRERFAKLIEASDLFQNPLCWEEAKIIGREIRAGVEGDNTGSHRLGPAFRKVLKTDATQREVA